MDGYHGIADAFFGHRSREAFYMRRALRSEQPVIGWLSARPEVECSRAEDVVTQLRAG